MFAKTNDILFKDKNFHIYILLLQVVLKKLTIK